MVYNIIENSVSKQYETSQSSLPAGRSHSHTTQIKIAIQDPAIVAKEKLQPFVDQCMIC